MRKKETSVLIIGSLMLLMCFAILSQLLSLPMTVVMSGATLGVAVTVIGYFAHCWAMNRTFGLQMKVVWGGALIRLVIFILAASLLHMKMGWPIAPLIFPMITAYVLGTLIEGVALSLANDKLTTAKPRTSKEANGN